MNLADYKSTREMALGERWWSVSNESWACFSLMGYVLRHILMFLSRCG